MSQSPILKALSSIRTSGARTLLMGGHACVFYGAAEFSRDLDLRRLAACLLLCACLVACHKSAPPPIDPALASCVLPDTTILAGIDLARLRSSPLYPKLTAAIRAELEPLRDATYLLIASNGSSYSLAARGNFHEPPPGATLLAPGLVLTGSPDAVRAATAQFHAASTAAPLILTRAAPLAPANEIWLVVQGSAALPLSGNAANITNLLRATRYATLTAHVADSLQITVTGLCASASAAQHLEESLRAMITLASTAEARRPDIAAQLHAIQLDHNGSNVTLTLNAAPGNLERLLQLF